jgi:hypothetical protein
VPVAVTVNVGVPVPAQTDAGEDGCPVIEVVVFTITTVEAVPVQPLASVTVRL